MRGEPFRGVAKSDRIRGERLRGLQFVSGTQATSMVNSSIVA